MINKLVIVGVGLIGGSLALALRRAGAVGQIVGCSRNQANLQRAEELGVIDAYERDIAAAVADADCVMVCVPLGAMAAVFEQMADALNPGTIVTDAGSAKMSVLQDAARAFENCDVHFVAGHPIAGTENSGVEAAFPDLYVNRRVILTPVESTDQDALATVRQLWSNAGANVTEMTPEHHDEVLAATSHLPHVLAFGLVDTLAQMEDRHEIFAYAAGGFRDFTRIAASDPAMWRDICLANRDQLLAVMDRYTADVSSLREMIARADGEAVESLFARAQRARRSLTHFN